METNTACDHRQSNGKATEADLAEFSTGDECPICGCTLGTDGYWYIDADQAPTANDDELVEDELDDEELDAALVGMGYDPADLENDGGVDRRWDVYYAAQND